MEIDPIIEHLGDNIFPDIPLSKSATIEREKMLKFPSYFTKEQITAFTLSMKSLYMLYNQRIQEACGLSLKALKYDITSIDSYQTLIQTASLFIDTETKICLYMQLASLYKSRYLKKVIEISSPATFHRRIKRRKIQRENINNQGNNENRDKNSNDIKNFILTNKENENNDQILIQLILQPYIRLLFSLGETSSLGDNPILSMQCYEEVLRFDFHNKFAANNLVVSYIKVIGMRKRGICHQPKRTMWHLKILLDLYDSLLDEEVKFCGKLVLSYFFRAEINLNKNNDFFSMDLNTDVNGDIYDDRVCWEGLDEWSEIAKEFNKNYPKAVSFIFMEKSGKSDFPLIPAFQEWLDLVVDMHEILRGKSESFYKYIHEKNKANEAFRSRTGKRVMAKAGNEHLEKARVSLRERNYIDTVNECTLAKRMFSEANYPSNKWYLNSPFPIVSNRAVACFHLELWMVVLHDIRFTLMMNPRHQKSYVLMKKVALIYGCDLLAQKMDNVIQKVVCNELNEKEWNCISKRAIALLSLEAFALSKDGELNEQNIEHLMKVGIEDCFRELPCSTNLVPQLPWINE
ncbi:hypothetical protein M9Y10_014609 [Tritrichomonas musculus]|uniref:KIF-binding protein n=1 Tax=Tritrichomonas musculus TaxID=1915356 RepID=A0ABR2KZZ5_9EUKA